MNEENLASKLVTATSMEKNWAPLQSGSHVLETFGIIISLEYKQKQKLVSQSIPITNTSTERNLAWYDKHETRWSQKNMKKFVNKKHLSE